MLIQICVGSSCHLKGAPEIVDLLKRAVLEYGLENEVTLAGSFCIGQCNRDGVTIQVDDTVYSGVTVAGLEDFFRNNILKKLGKEITDICKTV